MECKNSKEKEFVVDIENFESRDESQATEISTSGNKWLKKSLNKLVSGRFGIIASNKNVDSDNLLREFRQMAVKSHKHPKPPRPPKGPSLDAADMRFVNEISKIALKKKERIQNLNEMKKMNQAGKTAISSSLFSPSSRSALSAMVVTLIFFLVLIFQGVSGSSSNFVLMEAPQLAPTSIPHRPSEYSHEWSSSSLPLS